MPQKKNPDTLELVRSIAGDASAGLNGLLTTLKGLPRAYNRDLQNATPHAWDAVDAVTDAVEVAAGAVGTATWNEESLSEAAGEGFSTATGVADLLAMQGVPFRKAHELVASASENGADYAALDSAAEDVLGNSLSQFVEPDAVEAALDPAESVAMRDSTGGPAPDEVVEQVTSVSATVAADEEKLAETRESLTSANAKLTEVMHKYD